MGDFLENGLLEASAAGLIRREVQSLCLELRPEAISLTDAWQFSDKYLGSALGREDGCADMDIHTIKGDFLCSFACFFFFSQSCFSHGYLGLFVGLYFLLLGRSHPHYFSVSF